MGAGAMGAREQAILIAGPTASGKSALALAVAERLGGVVINADSMQVYAELRILTARPGPSEEARAPHRLYGHVPIAEGYSVGRWLEDARLALEESRASGHRPIFAGGTGLYFKALTEGLSPMPEVPSDLRESLRARLSESGSPMLHAELVSRDPEAAACIRPSDAQRVLRALEVVEATGRPLSEWQREPRRGALIAPGQSRRVVLWPDREWLRARIDERVGVMLAAGALEEAQAVAALGLNPALPGYRAHGLRSLIAHLNGEVSLEEAAQRIRAETRQYAKRQFTWFGHQMVDWESIAPDEALRRLDAAS